VTQPKPVVAIIGRPNVGKSTLFNRLTRRKLAIVHDQPGVTRDRHYADTESFGRPYTLIDTGGFDPFGDDEMMQGIVTQVEIALHEADVIICVLDATAAPTSIDSEEVALLRRSDKPVVYVANKSDSERQETEGHELYRLGMENLIFVSALHGRGMADLEEALVAGLGTEAQLLSDEEVDEDLVRVAVIGRPNAGKSSLINRLVGEDRLLVDSRPGTTRDSIDTLVERGGKRYLFVDTAGLRRKAKVAKGKDTVEALSVIAAIRAVERAEVVVLILGLAVDRGRAVVLGLNKMDLLDPDATREAVRDARDVLSFVSWAPAVRLSAKTGRGVDKLLAAVSQARESFDKRVTTGELNRFFEGVLSKHPPPIQGGKAPRFYYITQAKARPPTFMIVTSHPDNLHFSYQRYVVNAIRDAFGFEGAPIRVRYRRKDRREKKRKKHKRGR